MKDHLFRLILIFLVIAGTTYAIFQYVFFKPSTQRNTKAAGETVTLSFTPASANLAVDAEETTTIKVKPSVDLIIRGYVLNVTFDKSKVEIKDISYKLGAVIPDLGQDNNDLTTINNAGVIRIRGQIDTADGKTLTSSTAEDVVTIKVKSKATGGASLSVNKDSVKFFRILTDMKIATVSGADNVNFDINGGGGTPTVTINPTLVVNAKLKLKLKFQGINSKPTDALNKLNVQVKLFNETSELSTDYKTAEFTANNEGVWSGEVSFNARSNNKYTVVIKGPYHLSKKICDEAPTETAGGTYSCSTGKITIKEGDNNLDFSKVILLAGDLPTQDGSVTAYDTSLVRNNLGKTDADSVSKSDVNRDGKVDTQDYSLIIAALSIKTDEL